MNSYFVIQCLSQSDLNLSSTFSFRPLSLPRDLCSSLTNFLIISTCYGALQHVSLYLLFLSPKIPLLYPLPSKFLLKTWEPAQRWPPLWSLSSFLRTHLHFMIVSTIWSWNHVNQLPKSGTISCWSLHPPGPSTMFGIR